jgi:hypothetical protein
VQVARYRCPKQGSGVPWRPNITQGFQTRQVAQVCRYVAILSETMNQRIHIHASACVSVSNDTMITSCHFTFFSQSLPASSGPDKKGSRPTERLRVIFVEKRHVPHHNEGVAVHMPL